MRIPNWTVLLLIGLFVPYALTIGWDLPWLHHLGVAAATFAVTLVLYILRWFSAGDVKLLAAVALWAGPTEILPVVFMTTLFGGIIALLILLLRKAPTIMLFRKVIDPGRLLPRWARHGLVPYGIAISAAALFLIPVRFAL